MNTVQTEIDVPAQPLPKLLLVGTLEEARKMGCRQRGGRLMTPSGRIVMSVGQGPHAFRGLKISDWVPTWFARKRPNFDKVAKTLDLIVKKSTSNMLESKTCSTCGHPALPHPYRHPLTVRLPGRVQS